MKPGFKQTDAGVIPEDWGVVRACEIGNFRGGNGFPLRAQGNNIGDYPFYKVSDMNNEGNETFMSTSNNWISEQARTELGATAFPKDAIVFAKVGAAIFLERKKILTQPSCIDNNMAAFVPRKDLVNYRFLHTQFLNIRFGAYVAATALPALSGNLIDQMPLLLPPLAEQEAIASALGDADALIESLERLIAKKRDVKQGAMQELLTARRRLPGFNGKWETKRLGEIGVFLKGSGVKKDEAQDGTLPCIRYGEIYTTHEYIVRTFCSWISHSVALTATRLQSGDILFAGSGETKEEIGKCAAFVGSEEAYAGGDIVILRPFNSDSCFLGYYLNSVPINKQKASMGQGDAIVHIGTQSLASIAVVLPSPTEQTAIATVLSDMDAELAALEAKLSKARAIKQGMMQELLTGRIRLK